MFSGAIELNPGSVLNSVQCDQLKYLYILVLHIRVYNNYKTKSLLQTFANANKRIPSLPPYYIVNLLSNINVYV